LHIAIRGGGSGQGGEARATTTPIPVVADDAAPVETGATERRIA